MKKYLFRAAALLLPTLLMMTLLCWFYAEQILNNFARPQLEKLTSEVLAAEVKIGQLSWTETGLEVHALGINRPGKLSVTVPRIALNFTLRQLWNRQLAALTISNPRLVLSQSSNDPAPAKTALKIPEQLPLTIERLRVTDGQLRLHTANRYWQLREINFSAALHQTTPFKLAARFGTDESIQLTASGAVEFTRQQTLILESFAWQGQQLLATPLRANLAETGVSLQRSTLQLKHFDHQQLLTILSAAGKPSLLPANLAFSLADLSVTLALQQQLTLDLQVASGRIDWNDLHGDFSRLTLRLDRQQGGWDIAGQLQGAGRSSLTFASRLTDELRLSGKAQLRIPDPDQFKAALFPGRPLRIAGGLQLSAAYSLAGNRLQLSSRMQGFAPERQKRDDLFNIATLSGHAKLLLDTDGEDFSLSLRLAQQPFISVTGNFRQLETSLSLPALQDLHLLLPPEQLPEQLQALKGLHAGGNFSRTAGDWHGKLQLTAEQVTLPELALHTLDCRSNLQFSPGQLSVRQSSCDFEITRNETLTAQVSTQFSGDFLPQRFSLTLKQLSIAQLNALSPDGQTGVGDAALLMHGEVAGDWPKGPIALNLNGALKVKEVLAGTFYADLSDYAGNFTLSGDFVPANATLQARSFTINLPKIGTLEASGFLSQHQLDLRGEVALEELKNSYGLRLRPLLSGFRPVFGELTLEGGLSLTTRLLWRQGGWQTRGELRLQDLNAEWERRRLIMSGGTGAIPFAFSSGMMSATETPAAADSGELSFAALSVGPASLEAGALQLAAAPNRLNVISPLQLQLAGGRVTIEQLALGWREGAPQGAGKILIAGVDLETLTEELGLPIMQGRFSADLGTIRYTDQQLKSDGLASIEVFGGHFQLRNMSSVEPFSSYPTFYTDIDFSGVDLLQATRTFNFGEMNGILDGHIHGLEIFGSTPAAFQAEFATRNTGKRNISVKALNNLSILSQGGISAALSQGIYQFIDFYRYRMIAIKCSLENDTFTLVGTALPGSRRYLVYGSLLPPRIDITTSTPTISFKEMVNRLGRLERAGKNQSQGGQK